MRQYSVGEAAQSLSMHRDTLRYYDKIALLCPARGENGYRYYTDGDLLLLKYIEVMKFAGFSLSEIAAVMRNRSGGSGEDLSDSMQLLARKQGELRGQIALFSLLIELIAAALHALEGKQSPADTQGIDRLVCEVFSKIREGKCDCE